MGAEMLHDLLLPLLLLRSLSWLSFKSSVMLTMVQTTDYRLHYSECSRYASKLRLRESFHCMCCRFFLLPSHRVAAALATHPLPTSISNHAAARNARTTWNSHQHQWQLCMAPSHHIPFASRPQVTEVGSGMSETQRA